MRIGIDFDNTIICYDRVFNTVGIEKGLVPESLDIGKGYVRDYLRKQGKEKEWIWLQGYVYGLRLSDAYPYDGFMRFLGYCKDHDIECVIVSHKTIYPYSGDKYNLHEAAKKWIHDNGIDLETHFELTKEEKVKRISDLNCSIFIDDLPEFLSLPGFPASMTKILFDPLNLINVKKESFLHVQNWNEIFTMIQRGIKSL